MDPFCYLCFLFVFCYAISSVPNAAFNFNEAYLLGKDQPLGSLICIVISCLFVTFPNGVLGLMQYLIVTIPDLCLPLGLGNFFLKIWPLQIMTMRTGQLKI